MDRVYFTDFEDMDTAEERTETDRSGVRTDPWSIEDFVGVFTSTGLVPDGEEYVSVHQVQTGRVIVNGRESVQTVEYKISFKFDPEFTAEMDDSFLAGIWVRTSAGGRVLSSELVYCTPDDIPKYYAMYTDGK